MNVVDISKKGTTPNEVLDKAKDVYDSVIVIGWNKDDAIEAFTSSNLTRKADINYLIDTVKHDILSGVWPEDD